MDPTGKTALELHRERFNVGPNPMRGPMLRFSDLNARERSLIEHDIMARVILGGEDMAGTLHSWGVICPHPIQSRLFEGLYWADVDVPFDDCSWYSCGVCQCIVINR